jgi:hypothetical protein
MKPGAHSPEELETLYEDAFLLRDPAAVAHLFAEGGVLAAGDGPLEARGGEEIARLAPALWAGGGTYLADPQRVVQARDTALVVAERGINVLRRGSGGAWRYVISLLALDDAKEER